MKLLSIIVPVYNKAAYIDLCVTSILTQTIIDFELILINDGSKDNSGEKCDAFKADSRVTVIHQINKGVSEARNAGLKIASGKYIGFVDADDYLEAGMYELLVNNIEKYNADISICGVKRVLPDKTELYGGNQTIKLFNTDEGITGLFSGEILLSNYDKLYRRDTVKDILFEPALFEDTYYNFEALLASKLTVYDDTIMYNYMIRDNSHSLAAFNQKYMNALLLTKRMIDVCLNTTPHHIASYHVAEAKAFDFNSNMINLNMILIGSKENHQKDYQIIVKNLSHYARFYANAKYVTKRYKYGYSIFRLSPKLYAAVLRLYSKLTNSDHLNRKQKLAIQPIN
jgi:glycosyltransferase involved in cell wall biosynthesis